MREVVCITMNEVNLNEGRNCTFCGCELPPRFQKRGPQQMEHKECNTARLYLEAFSRSLAAIPAMTPSKAAQLRGELFTLRNQGVPTSAKKALEGRVSKSLLQGEEGDGRHDVRERNEESQ